MVHEFASKMADLGGVLSKSRELPGRCHVHANPASVSWEKKENKK